MFVGILWCFCAFLCFKFLDKQNPRTKRAGIALGVFLIFFGICAILGGILNHSVLLATGIILPVALLCIAVFVFAVINSNKCNTPVTAICLRYREFRGNRGYRSYSPIFHYYFQGNSYESGVAENYSLKKITNLFQEGMSYQVWINEKAPELCITRKKVQGTHILCLVIGMMMLGLYFLLVLAGLFATSGHF